MKDLLVAGSEESPRTAAGMDFSPGEWPLPYDSKWKQIVLAGGRVRVPL